MAMGRQKDGQGDLVVSWSEMPRSPGHVFYGFVKLTGFTPKSRYIIDGYFTQFQWFSLTEKCRKLLTIS